MIYAHDGGPEMIDAEFSNPNLCRDSLNLNCVIFNVDYRFGSKNKCPKG